MKLVLDTNALWHRPLIEALGEARVQGCFEDGRLEAILPAIAYAERYRQILAAGHDAELWRERLEAVGIRVEAFGQHEADRLDPSAADRTVWERHARDLLVLAHVTGERRAVTADRTGVWRGRPRMDPAEATEAILQILAPS